MDQGNPSDAHYSAVQVSDAKLMWCPEARRLYCDEDGSGAGINRRTDFSPVKIAPCLGPDCMAWRWVPPGSVLALDGEEPVRAGEYTFGYCGKSGGR